MRFNALGDVASGNNAAAGEFAYNGTALAVGGVVTANHESYEAIAPSWLSDTQIAYFSIGVGGGGPNQIRSYDTAAMTTALLTAADVTHFAAGASIWAGNTTSGVVSNVPGATSLAGMFLGDVGTDDGSLAVIRDRATSLGLRVYSAAGATTVDLDDVVVAFNRVHVRGGMVAYQVGATWQLRTVDDQDVTYAARLDPINWLTPVLGDGDQLFCLERGFDATTTSDTLSVRYGDDPAGTGYLIASGANLLNPDLVALSGGVLRIGWATTTGEAIGDVALAELKPAEGVIRYGTVSAGVFTWGAWETIDTTTFDVGPVTGLETTLTLPSQDHPFVDRTGRITRPWLRVLQNVNTSIVQTTTVVARRGTVPTPTQGFTTLTSTGQPPLTAATNPALALEAGAGVAIALNPASNAATIRLTPSAATSGPPGVWGNDGWIGPPGPLAAVIGGATLYSRRTILTDAQIKALPSGAVELVPAMTGAITWLLGAYAVGLIIASYTNVQADAYWTIRSTNDEIGNYLGNDSTIPFTSLTTFLSTNVNDRTSVWFQPYTQAQPVFGWGNLPWARETSLESGNLNLFAENNGAGDYTGGDPANQLFVTTYYLVIPL